MSESTWPQRPGETFLHDVSYTDMFVNTNEQIVSVDSVGFDDETNLTISDIAFEPDRVQFRLAIDLTQTPDHRLLKTWVTTTLGNVINATGYLVIVDPYSDLSSYSVGYTTVERVKDQLGLTHNYDGARDLNLEALILETSRAIDTYCGRTFGEGTYTENFKSLGYAPTPQSPPAEGGGLWRGRTWVQLRNYPIVSVENIEDSEGTVMDPTSYVINSNIGRLDFPFGHPGEMTIDYTAGYKLPTATQRNLPHDIELACTQLVLAQYYGGQRDPAVRSETAVDVGTIQYFKHGGSLGALLDTQVPTPIAALLANYRDERSIVGIM